jgi:hypothetical protein
MKRFFLKNTCWMLSPWSKKYHENEIFTISLYKCIYNVDCNIVKTNTLYPNTLQKEINKCLKIFHTTTIMNDYISQSIYVCFYNCRLNSCFQKNNDKKSINIPYSIFFNQCI